MGRLWAAGKIELSRYTALNKVLKSRKYSFFIKFLMVFNTFAIFLFVDFFIVHFFQVYYK